MERKISTNLNIFGLLLKDERTHKLDKLKVCMLISILGISIVAIGYLKS